MKTIDEIQEIEDLAEQIIDMITDENLVSMECAEDRYHDVIAVWRVDAKEQIAMRIQSFIRKFVI